MDGGSALVAAVDARQAAALALLEQLVNLDAGTFAQAGVDRVGAVLAAPATGRGCSVERVPPSLLVRK
jgi:hypothetical protein